MIRFSDGSHCHWTYRVGSYESFLNWPNREDAVEALGDHAGEVFQRHGNQCACPPDLQEATMRDTP